MMCDNTNVSQMPEIRNISTYENIQYLNLILKNFNIKADNFARLFSKNNGVPSLYITGSTALSCVYGEDFENSDIDIMYYVSSEEEKSEYIKKFTKYFKTFCGYELTNEIFHEDNGNNSFYGYSTHILGTLTFTNSSLNTKVDVVFTNKLFPEFCHEIDFTLGMTYITYERSFVDNKTIIPQLYTQCDYDDLSNKTLRFIGFNYDDSQKSVSYYRRRYNRLIKYLNRGFNSDETELITYLGFLEGGMLNLLPQND